MGVMGSGQALQGQDKRHIRGTVPDHGEGVALGNFKEVLLGGTRGDFCPHMGRCISLVLHVVTLFLDGHRAENPTSANKGQPASGYSITSATSDPHGLHARLGGFLREHMARHKQLFRAP